MFGLVNVWSRPLETLTVTSPAQVYRSDRSRIIVVGLVVEVVGGLVGGLAVGFVDGLAVGLVFGLGSAADLHVMGLTWLLRGKRVRFVPLLQAAAERQVLRQVGAVCQFRHAALQDLLAGPRPATTTMTPTPDTQAAHVTDH
jgi:hypothetical protein